MYIHHFDTALSIIVMIDTLTLVILVHLCLHPNIEVYTLVRNIQCVYTSDNNYYGLMSVLNDVSESYATGPNFVQDFKDFDEISLELDMISRPYPTKYTEFTGISVMDYGISTKTSAR